MATIATAGQPGAGVSREERRVILASSVGTIFEWYDFYLYATMARFFAAPGFPPGNDTAALLSAFANLCRGLPHPSVRRRHLWTHRGPGRTQVHVPRHHLCDGSGDLCRRAAAHLRHADLADRRANGWHWLD